MIYIIPIKKFSYDVQWEQSIGFLFIDGSHTYKAVSSDFNKFSKFVEKKGLIAFHDYGDFGMSNGFGYGRSIEYSPWPDVTKFVNELLIDKWKKVFHIDSLIIIQKKHT